MQTVQTSNIGNTFAVDSAMTQEEYLTLREAAGTEKATAEEAAAFICKEFGFDEKKIVVLDTAELRVYAGAQTTKPAGAEIERRPLYNATDWNYARFRVCGRLWEVVNGDLEAIAE